MIDLTVRAEVGKNLEKNKNIKHEVWRETEREESLRSVNKFRASYLRVREHLMNSQGQQVLPGPAGRTFPFVLLCSSEQTHFYVKASTL